MGNFLLRFFLVLLAEYSCAEKSIAEFKHWNAFYNKEYYSTSVLGFVQLLNLEREFMDNLTLYADAQQEKVNNLNIYLDLLTRNNHATPRERERFVSNPLNAFGLIRRLHQDWPKWQNYTKKPSGLEQLNGMEAIVSKAPDTFDMNKTLRSMHRIENIIPSANY